MKKTSTDTVERRKNRQSEILDFWFGKLPDEKMFPYEKSLMWFEHGSNFDAVIKSEFSADWAAAVEGRLSSWERTARGSLALIIVLDQFSRHMFRHAPQSFEQDARALSVAENGVVRGLDRKLKPLERLFFYLPFEHAEDLEIQKKSMSLFKQLTESSPVELHFFLEHAKDYAQKHYDVIARFGRFPHRNQTLGRKSTPEELRFLKEPGSSF